MSTGSHRTVPPPYTDLPTPLERAAAEVQKRFGLSLSELPPPSLSVDVAVAGGGLGGLLLALGLQERGVACHVFEAAPELRTDSGTVFSVGKHGQNALEGVKPGLAASLFPSNQGPTRMILIFKEKSGVPPRVVERTGGVYGGLGGVAWNKAQQVLASHVAPDLVHCGKRLVTYLAHGDGVHAIFEEKPEASSQDTPVVVQAKFLVGADGMFSRVRWTMVGDEPRYLGCINWNALVPATAATRMKLGYESFQLVACRDFDAALSFMVADVGTDTSFWNFRIFDQGSSGQHASNATFGGLGKSGAKDRALSLLRDRVSKRKEDHWGDMWGILAETEEQMIYERRMVDRLPLASWSDASKKVVLLGDAAHGLYPGVGQGAQLAFEDAHQLILGLDGVPWADQPHAVEEALWVAVSRYEEARVERCAKVQRFAAEESGLPRDETQSEEVRGLGPEARAKRAAEFAAWLAQYPNNAQGDPHSVYWK